MLMALAGVVPDPTAVPPRHRSLPDVLNEVQGYSVGRVEGCVTVGGQPAPGARVAVGPKHPTTGQITLLATLFVTRDDGCYDGTMYPGDWGVAASLQGTPYPGGGILPTVQTITVVEDQTTSVPTLALPSTGRVEVSVLDESGVAVPARVSVVGFVVSMRTGDRGTHIATVLKTFLVRAGVAGEPC